MGVSGAMKHSEDDEVGEFESGSTFWVPSPDPELLAEGADGIGSARSSRRSATVGGWPDSVVRDDGEVAPALEVTSSSKFSASFNSFCGYRLLSMSARRRNEGRQTQPQA